MTGKVNGGGIGAGAFVPNPQSAIRNPQWERSVAFFFMDIHPSGGTGGVRPDASVLA
jgi:hypothetical protein